MPLGDLVVKLSADIATFQSDLGRAQHLAQKFGRDIQKAFQIVGVGIGVGVFTKFIKDTIDAGDRLNDLRTRTGLTGQQLLELEGAAARSGVQINEVGDVVSKLTRRLGEAQKGTGDAAAAYQALGISVTDSNGNLKSTDRILGELGAKFSEFEDGTNKALLAIAALGKGGDRLIPMLEALEETRARLKRLGVTIDEEFITGADRFKDKLEDLSSVNQVLGRQIATALLPHLENFVDALIDLTQKSNTAQVAVNAIIIPLKVMAAGFVTLTGTVAAAGEMLAGFSAFLSTRLSQQLQAYGEYLQGLKEFDLGKTVEAAKKLISLDFSEPAREWATAWERAKGRMEGVASSVTKLDVFGTGGPASGSWWGDEERGRRRPAPGLPDLAAGKAAQDALRKLLDQRAKLELDALKDMAKARESVLDAMYAAHLVSERGFWDEKAAIRRHELDAELKALGEQIETQQRVLNATKMGTKDYWVALGNLNESQAKSTKLVLEFQTQSTLAYFQAQQSADNYRRSIRELDAQILDLLGHTAQAAAIRFDSANEDLSKRINANLFNNPLGVADAARFELFRRVTAQQSEFNALLEQQSIISARSAIEEERLQIAARTGQLSQIDLLTQTSELRKRQVALYEQQLRALEAISNPTEKQILQIEQMRLEIERLAAETNLLARTFDDILSDSFSSAFSDFISGTKSAKEAFNDFSNSVMKRVNDMIADALSKKLFSALGLDGKGGGLLALLFGGAGATTAGIGYGAAGTAAASASVVGAGGVLVPALASGTDYVPRDMLAMIHRGEAVIPANENRYRGSVNVNVYTQGEGISKKTLLQVGAEAQMALARSARNT